MMRNAGSSCAFRCRNERPEDIPRRHGGFTRVIARFFYYTDAAVA